MARNRNMEHLGVFSSGNAEEEKLSKAELKYLQQLEKQEQQRARKESKRQQEEQDARQIEQEVASRQRRLMPIQEIISEIELRPDELPKAAFELSYVDRFKGILRISLNEFEAEAIPLHRVRTLHVGDEVVWDREQRIDRYSTGEVQQLVTPYRTLISNDEVTHD